MKLFGNLRNFTSMQSEWFAQSCLLLKSSNLSDKFHPVEFTGPLARFHNSLLTYERRFGLETHDTRAVMSVLWDIVGKLNLYSRVLDSQSLKRVSRASAWNIPVAFSSSCTSGEPILSCEEDYVTSSIRPPVRHIQKNFCL